MPGQTVPNAAGELLAEMARAAAVIVEQWPAAAGDRPGGQAVRRAGLAITELILDELAGDHERAAQIAAEVADIAAAAADIADGGAR